MSLTIDEILEKIGGHGRFQTMICLCMSYIYMSMVAFHLMVIAFIAGEPYWECVQNSTVCNLTEAVSTISKHYKKRCDLPRTEWKFTDSYTSTVTEYDLVCGDSILQSVVSSIFWVGWFIGNIVMGYLSDKLGRKKAIQLSVVLVFFSSWVLIWPKNLWIFMVCRFVTGIGSGGASMCGFIIVVEFSTSKRRGMVGTITWLSGPLIYSLMALFAYLIRDWRYLMLFGTLLGTPVMIFIWFIPETPRHLLVHGKYDEARVVLTKIAKWNKKQMPQDDIFVPKQPDDEKANFRYLFYNKSVSLITVATWLLWFTVALMFYAVSYNAVYLGGSIYISFFATNVVSFPANGIAVLTVKKFGRKNSIMIGLFIAALCTVITVSIPADRTNAGFSAGRIITAMFAKGSIVISFISLYVQGGEVFPTTVRNIGMGTASASARIGSFIALYIIWLQRIHRYVPYAILGFLCLLSGTVCHVFIPETRGVTTREVLVVAKFSEKDDVRHAEQNEVAMEKKETTTDKSSQEKNPSHLQSYENKMEIK